MTRLCPCGFQFEIAERENETLAHAGPMLSTEVPPVQLNVERVEYAKHVGKSGVPTLKVTYYCGLRSVSEYVCIEHSGYARTKAVNWWGSRWNNRFDPVPVSVDDALVITHELLEPEQIVVSFSTKYPEIKRHVFDVETTAA
jgi:DNA repair protein RadD